MLKKFVAIKNVGTFRNAAAAGDVELRKMTLIHAENGRGKTTLCAILRSLKNGDANLILERKTLDGTVGDVPEVKILFDSGVTEFKAGAWTPNKTSVEIFDATFIAENVYSGDVITHDHKKNLCRVVLGVEGVKLAKAFDDVDAEVRLAGNLVGTTKADATKLVPGGMTLDQLIALPIDPGIEKNIEDKRAEISVLNDAENIKKRAKLAPITIPQPPGNLTDTLRKTVDGISAEAVAMVRNHIASHKMAGRGETWLAEGLQYVTAEDCPFCAQTLGDSPLLDTLKVFFSTAYRTFQSELSQISKGVDSTLSDAILMNVQKILTENSLSVEFWKKYTAAPPPALSFDDRIKPVITRLRNSIAPLVAQKLASPLERVEHSPESLEAIKDWSALRDEVTTHNEQVAVFNAAVEAVKAGLATKNMVVLRQELARLEAQKVRHDPATVIILTAYAAAMVAKATKDIEKDKAKAALDTYNLTVVEVYKDAVNELLVRFGAAFTLSKVKVEYTGRTPRAGYSFVIRGKEIDPGNDNTPLGSPQFRNTLSSGDRNTLALAFFMAQLKTRTDIADLVVVFDDPFTSLDAFRQSYTCSAIRNLSTKAKQVIVLSHSLDFCGS